MKNFAKIFLTIVVIFAILVIIAIITPTNNNNQVSNKTYKNVQLNTQNENIQWLIAAHDYGNNYPYTEDYLQLYCYADAVWLESNEGYIYPLNGVAKSSELKNSKKYRNNTTPILKEGMQDLFTPIEALKICYKLNVGEFQARLK